MAAKTFNVEINGYWRDINKGGLPSHSGVYFVYECTYNKNNNGKGTVTLQRLLYIGESNNVNKRVLDHEKYDDWTRLLHKGNTLCFSTGAVEEYYRNRIEAAYIFQHKPPLNTEYKNSFPFDATTIKSSGQTALLNTNFTVHRTS